MRTTTSVPVVGLKIWRVGGQEKEDLLKEKILRLEVKESRYDFFKPDDSSKKRMNEFGFFYLPVL